MTGPFRWLFPHDPRLVERLCEQAAVCESAARELCNWAGGDDAASYRLRQIEHDADDLKREFLSDLRVAFAPPIEGEDLFALCQGFEGIINNMKNLVREADVLDLGPDDALVKMSSKLEEGVTALGEAVAHIAADDDTATHAADRAIKCDHALEHLYRAAMSASLEVDDFREVVGRRELYRRMARLGEALSLVGDRVWYAVIKEG